MVQSSMYQCVGQPTNMIAFDLQGRPIKTDDAASAGVRAGNFEITRSITLLY